MPARMVLLKMPARRQRSETWRAQVDYRDADGRRRRVAVTRTDQGDAVEALVERLEDVGVAGEVIDRLLDHLLSELENQP
ncbi:hypothetical protein [Nocardia amamiensis]|uniref:hypothetical protein n=1 Tax=Nocardia amamiensis TaxID=404578 RepID=UPI0033DB14D4